MKVILLPRHKLSTIILVMFILTSMILSACAPATSQSTNLPKRVATFSVVPTEVQTIATMEATKTRKPRATIRMFIPSETPFASPNPTDVAMYAQMTNALEAATTLVSSLPNATQEEITKAVFTKWLDYYKTYQMDAYLRLKDYKIEQVTAKGHCDSATTTKYLSSVQYSVQTVTPHPGDWVAFGGNLTLTSDNWVNQITAYVGITVGKDSYTMNLEGVPPCSSN